MAELPLHHVCACGVGSVGRVWEMHSQGVGKVAREERPWAGRAGGASHACHAPPQGGRWDVVEFRGTRAGEARVLTE